MYERGRSAITVERAVPENKAPIPEAEDSSFLTAYQMVRQQADLEVHEPGVSPLESLATAVQSIARRGCKLTMFVCERREILRAWLPSNLRAEEVWGVPILEDPELKESGVLVVGSSTGQLIREIECAVFCKIESKP